MSKNFQKIKNKYLVSAVLKSVLFGVCAGVFAACLILLILKLTGVRLNAGYYVLIGVVVAAGCGALSFFLIRPNEYFVAKQLDEGYGLNEKIKTMIACKDAEGDIITLQREDAEQKLENLSPKKPSLKRILVCVAAAVVAIAMLLTAVLVPARYKDEDDGYEYTNVQEISLRQLIEDVKKSNLEDMQKDATVAVLTDLANSLGETLQNSVMRKNVVSAVLLINDILYTPNSFIKISAQMTASENADVQRVSEAVIRGVQSYKNGGRIADIRKVEELASNVDGDAAALFSDSLSSMRVEWQDMQGPTLAQSLTTFQAALKDAVEKSGTDENDGLYKLLLEFAAKLEGIAGKIRTGGVSINTIQSEISTTLNNSTISCGAAMGDQAYNCIMYDFVRTRLVEIFGLRESDFPSDMPGGPQTPGEGNQQGSNSNDDPNNPSQSGGAISGDKNYGSDDTVYSPELDAYVKYGEVLKAYEAEMRERIANGETTEELAAFIIRYLEILYSGPDKSESAGN